MDPHRLGLVSTKLHYFQLVARLGSIRRAAQTLNVAPSSISRVITQLEDDLKTPLFERVRQRLKITSAGELLLYRSRLSVKELTRACTEIDDLQGLRRGTVSIAVVESVARGIIPDAVAEFWKRFPAVTVDVKVMGSQHAFDAVAEGECDAALAFDVRAPRNAQRLSTAPLNLGVILRPEHPLAARSELKLSDLVEERVILSDSSLALGVSVDEALSSMPLEMGRLGRTNSIGVMIDLAVRGAGLALQTRLGAERELREGSLVFVPMRDPKLRARKLNLIARSGSALSEAATSLTATLTRILQSLEP
jgi:DNA-binding transcriptional LysR family regulator